MSGDGTAEVVSDSTSRPRNRSVHLFSALGRRHALIVNGSRLYGIPSPLAGELDTAISSGHQAEVDSLIRSAGLEDSEYVSDEVPKQMPITSLSLAAAQKCNLGCTYCYAQEGDFGGAAKNMPIGVAKASVDTLLKEAEHGGRVQLTFLGGEPLANRKVLREATEYARERGEAAGVQVGFSLTTNGTMLTEEDGEFFERHGFAVTVSLDGPEEVHDRLRHFKSGRGSYAKIIDRIKPLLAMQRTMQVSARVTVTPSNLGFRETLDEFVRLGFHSVGFSPMLSSPTGRDQMEAPDLQVMLSGMIECGEQFERKLLAGERYPFLNMSSAMAELHKGTHRPYPCGAGAGYLGVSAEGGLFACHRFVDDDANGGMGSLAEGVERKKQSAWLSDRHVHFQDPCNRCWARYLCGGGCHHEVIHRGRPACDYIRGWLHYCLQAYARLLDSNPTYFGSP